MQRGCGVNLERARLVSLERDELGHFPMRRPLRSLKVSISFRVVSMVFQGSYGFHDFGFYGYQGFRIFLKKLNLGAE